MMAAARQGLDAFTKRYLTAILLVAAMLLLWWLAGLDSRVSALNALLRSDPELAAQAALVQVQSRAGQLVSGQDDVNSIRWTLDRDWYAYHGIYLD